MNINEKRAEYAQVLEDMKTSLAEWRPSLASRIETSGTSSSLSGVPNASPPRSKQPISMRGWPVRDSVTPARTPRRGAAVAPGR